mgnify:CR=1 FL=1
MAKRHDFRYFFHEGLNNMFSHGFMSFAAIGITVACLLIMGTFTLVAVNANALLADLEQENEILAYVDDSYTEEQAKEFMAEDPSKVFVEDSGRGWRRVVASPDPKKIVEADSILNLLDNEFIVIACGGGGIPVVRDYENKGCYKGVPAVIDKDLGGELLAEDCDADVLFLLTAVEHVAINFGKPNQEELEDLTADEAERLADEGQFGKGSMEPKVRAAIKFARSRKGRTCIIGALDKAAETMAGLSGTRIHE